MELDTNMAMFIAEALKRDNPQYFKSLVACKEIEDNEKRELLQKQKNLSEDLDNITVSLQECESTIEQLSTLLKSVNGKRGWLLKQQKTLSKELENVHLTWIKRFSANNNASV